MRVRIYLLVAGVVYLSSSLLSIASPAPVSNAAHMAARELVAPLTHQPVEVSLVKRDAYVALRREVVVAIGNFVYKFLTAWHYWRFCMVKKLIDFPLGALGPDLDHGFQREKVFDDYMHGRLRERNPDLQAVGDKLKDECIKEVKGFKKGLLDQGLFSPGDIFEFSC